MILDYIGVNEMSGSLIVLDDVENASYEEVVDIRLGDGSRRTGRIVQLDGKRAVVQVFEGTRGISLENTADSSAWPPDGDAAFAGDPWQSI